MKSMVKCQQLNKYDLLNLKTAVGDGQERQDFDSESFMQEVDIPYW